jgi:hypothetical protein
VTDEFDKALAALAGGDSIGRRALCTCLDAVCAGEPAIALYFSLSAQDAREHSLRFGGPMASAWLFGGDVQQRAKLRLDMDFVGVVGQRHGGRRSPTVRSTKPPAYVGGSWKRGRTDTAPRFKLNSNTSRSGLGRFGLLRCEEPTEHRLLKLTQGPDSMLAGGVVFARPPCLKMQVHPSRPSSLIRPRASQQQAYSRGLSMLPAKCKSGAKPSAAHPGRQPSRMRCRKWVSSDSGKSDSCCERNMIDEQVCTDEYNLTCH